MDAMGKTRVPQVQCGSKCRWPKLQGRIEGAAPVSPVGFRRCARTPELVAREVSFPNVRTSFGWGDAVRMVGLVKKRLLQLSAPQVLRHQQDFPF